MAKPGTTPPRAGTGTTPPRAETGTTPKNANFHDLGSTRDPKE